MAVAPMDAAAASVVVAPAVVRGAWAVVATEARVVVAADWDSAATVAMAAAVVLAAMVATAGVAGTGHAGMVAAKVGLWGAAEGAMGATWAGAATVCRNRFASPKL